MILFPAIDILDKKVVRLVKGKRDKKTIYGEPLEIAKAYQKDGAEYLHVVDLNGAFDNSNINLDIIKEIKKQVNIPIQLGGGLKTKDKIEYLLNDVGVDRVILGTICVTNQKLVQEMAKKYKERIVASVDVKDNFVQTHGWTGESKKMAFELISTLKGYGINTFVYTDVKRDGCLTGVNIDNTVKIFKDCNVNIIASGGLKDLNDIKILKEKNLYGAILGKALYEKVFTLKDALNIAKN